MTLLLGTAGIVASALAPAAGYAQSAASVVESVAVSPMPDYSPLNPLVVERSGLYLQPYLPLRDGWQLGMSVEYGSAVERNINFPDSYLLDAELARVRVRLHRDLSDRVFVLADGGVAWAYAGVADGLFEDYHRLIRFTMEERDTRPRNSYGDRLLLRQWDIDRVRESQSPLPTDLRLGIGLRGAAGMQTVLSATIPTAPSSSVFNRGVPTLSLLQTVRLPETSRLLVELAGGAGFTPRHGILEPVQRTTFLLGSGSARLRLWGNNAVFATFYGHSAPYRGTHFPELDTAGLGIDFGYSWQSRSGRQWRIGLTEDVRRRDPEVDLTLRLSTTR